MSSKVVGSICFYYLKEFQETMEAASSLMKECIVVVDLEGLQEGYRQRSIDVLSGVCYVMDCHMQMITDHVGMMIPSIYECRRENKDDIEE